MNNNKIVILVTILLTFLISPLNAGCGNCQADIPSSPKEDEISSALVTSIPKNGNVEGLVIASCGICNFDSRKSRSCSLFIKINNEIYPVNGTTVNDHGDMHAKEGFCRVKRIAYVSGNIKKGIFYSNIFKLIESPKL